MEIRIARRKYKVFAFDVESHNDYFSEIIQETSIWLYSFIDETSSPDDESSYGYNLKSFFDKLEELSTPKRTRSVRPIKNILIYIYNLSFERSFLLPYLLKAGFTYKEKIEEKDEFVFNSISNKSVASVWDAEIKIHKKSGIIVFKDMAKILPGGLRKVAKSFNLKTQKGDIDYKLDRNYNYNVTKEEKIYCFKDTRILVDIIDIMNKKEDKDFFKSSSAASYSCRKMIKEGYPRSYKPLKAFRKDYPLLDEKESTFLRKGVGGGITYAPERYQFKEINQRIIHIDIHQAHPSQGYKHVFPYGKGIYFEKQAPADHFYISCLHIKISYSGVRLHNIIQLIGLDIQDNKELYVWDFEIPVMKKCYENFKYEIIDGYAYRVKKLPWRKYYLENFDKREIAKKIKDFFHIMYYKLLNNSSYGKLLEKGHNEIYINTVREDGIIDSDIQPKSEIKVNSTYTYLPVGSCIPAYTRCFLVNTALKFGYENIVYFDTDSIFIIKNDFTKSVLKTLDLSDTLGAWGLEKEIKRGQFAAPKRYKLITEEENGKESQEIHMAGVNFVDDVLYDELNIVESHFKIQGIKRVKGGTIVVLKEKDIGIQDKYKLIYNKNKV